MLSEPTPELELRDYLRVVQRRRWTIALIAVLVVAAALGASLLQTPIYQGTAEILLQGRSTESLFDPQTGARSDPNRVVQTEIQVLRTNAVRDKVRAELGVAPAVSASPVGQTDLIRVQATSTDPAQAAKVANAYATAYIEHRRQKSVDDLVAAGARLQEAINDIQKQIDALPAAPVASKPTESAPADPNATRRNNLVQQQALFKQKLDQMGVDASLKTGGAQLVTLAAAPESPIRPTPKRNGAVALVLGLMLGVGVAFLREHLDESIKGKDDIDRAAHGLELLGMVPEVDGWKDRKETVLVSLAEPTSTAAEAYRSLRTSVQFLGLDQPMRTLQVTSPASSEGKSTTLANLAVALAKAGQRVIVVDCDLRRPRIHHFFGLEHTIGFTSVLLGEVPLSGALQDVPGVEGLRLLASGPIPPNPSELLLGRRTVELLTALQSQADIVLIDAPPVLPVSDAAVLSHRVDAVLVVATAGVTTRKSLQRAIETLNQVDAPIIGVLLNGVTAESGYGYGYGYGYSYGYRYETDQPKGRGKKAAGRSTADEFIPEPIERP